MSHSSMTLATFLQKAAQTGHDRFKLSSEARGVEVARGDLATATAEDLEQLARNDAQHLAREPLHAYTLVAESSDGAKLTRHTLRVPGGQSTELDVHRVDVQTSGTQSAVVGHLVRLIVEDRKVTFAMFEKLMSKIVDRDIDENREIVKLRRAVLRGGENAIEAKIIEQQAEAEKERRHIESERWREVIGIAKPFALRMLPGGSKDALADFRSSLSDQQHAELCALLGPVTFGKLLSLDSPEKVGELWISTIPADIGERVLAALTPAQQALVQAALTKTMERFNKAHAGEAEPVATNSAPAQGAPS